MPLRLRSKPLYHRANACELRPFLGVMFGAAIAPPIPTSVVVPHEIQCVEWPAPAPTANGLRVENDDAVGVCPAIIARALVEGVIYFVRLLLEAMQRDMNAAALRSALVWRIGVANVIQAVIISIVINKKCSLIEFDKSSLGLLAMELE